MTSYRLGGAAAVALLLAARPALAAVHVTDPSAPQTVPAAKVQRLAQAPSPDACVQAVRLGQQDKWLAVSRGVGRELRAGAKVWLTKAAIAASEGDERACWRDYNLAEELKSP